MNNFEETLRLMQNTNAKSLNISTVFLFTRKIFGMGFFLQRKSTTNLGVSPFFQKEKVTISIGRETKTHI